MNEQDNINLKTLQQQFTDTTDFPSWVYNIKDIANNEKHCKKIYNQLVECCIKLYHLLHNVLYSKKQIQKLVDDFIDEINFLYLLLTKPLDDLTPEQQLNDILIYLICKLFKLLKIKQSAIDLQLFEVANNIKMFIDMTTIPNPNFNKNDLIEQ